MSEKEKWQHHRHRKTPGSEISEVNGKKKILPDFSHLFVPNNANLNLKKYYAKVCGRCGGMCCSFNISPVDFRYSLGWNMNNDNIRIVRKGLMLCRDYRKRFTENVKLSLNYLESRGFGVGLSDLVEQHKFSLKAVIKAYMIIHREIENYNNRITAADKFDSEYRAIRDCFFLIPGRGCVFEEYRPFTCVTAFRKCFRELKLFEFVESRINEAEADELFEYIRLDFELGGASKPRIIINADEKLKKNLSKLLKEKLPGHFGKLTYFQLAKLADFITYPFYKEPDCLDGMLEEKIFYFAHKVKDAPLITFVDNLEEGESNSNFEFGLDYVQVFRVSPPNKVVE